MLCTNSATFTIANIGAANAGSFKVLIQGDPGLAQTEIITVLSLAVGSTKTFTVALPAGGNCYDPDCTMKREWAQVLQYNKGYTILAI